MKKTIKDINYTDVVISSYNLLQHLGYSARISDLWKMLCIVFGIQEFEILDLRSRNVGEFESYMFDKLIDWKQGKEIDFQEIENSIFEFGDFTGREKMLLTSGNLQERLWAIFLCLVDPNMELKNYKND